MSFLRSLYSHFIHLINFFFLSVCIGLVYCSVLIGILTQNQCNIGNNHKTNGVLIHRKYQGNRLTNLQAIFGIILSLFLKQHKTSEDLK